VSRLDPGVSAADHHDIVTGVTRVHGIVFLSPVFRTDRFCLHSTPKPAIFSRFRDIESFKSARRRRASAEKSDVLHGTNYALIYFDEKKCKWQTDLYRGLRKEPSRSRFDENGLPVHPLPPSA
jgi:hypothetical protein